MKFSGHHQGFIFSSIFWVPLLDDGPKENWTVELMSFTELHTQYIQDFFDEAIFSCCFNSQNDNDGLWVKFVAQHHPSLNCWWTEFVSWVLEEMLLQEEPDSSSNRHLTSQTENLCCFVFQLGFKCLPC